MKYITAIVIPLIVFSACKTNTLNSKKSAPIVKDEQYPTEIANAGYQRLFDETKWRLYCIHCDQKIVFLNKSLGDNVTFSQCQLEFDQLKKRADSVEIDFMFYYKNIKLNGASLLMTLPTYGAVFKLPDSLVEYSSRDNVRYFSHRCIDPAKGCNDRYINPLQPEVISYIKQNKAKINPWFRKEAIKRGVINE